MSACGGRITNTVKCWQGRNAPQRRHRTHAACRDQTHAASNACCLLSSAPQCICTAQWVCKGTLHCIRCGGASYTEEPSRTASTGGAGTCASACSMVRLCQKQMPKPVAPILCIRNCRSLLHAGGMDIPVPGALRPPRNLFTDNQRAHAASNAGPQADTLVLQAPLLAHIARAPCQQASSAAVSLCHHGPRRQQRAQAAFFAYT